MTDCAVRENEGRTVIDNAGRTEPPERRSLRIACVNTLFLRVFGRLAGTILVRVKVLVSFANVGDEDVVFGIRAAAYALFKIIAVDHIGEQNARTLLFGESLV